MREVTILISKEYRGSYNTVKLKAHEEDSIAEVFKKAEKMIGVPMKHLAVLEGGNR